MNDASSRQARRQARQLRLLMIALPMAVALVYFLLLAGNRYVSESVVTVRRANQDGGGVPGVALLLAGVSPPSREDALYLKQYIHSPDLLAALDAELGLRKHFESQSHDPLYRLYRGTSREWLLEYFRARVEVSFDDPSSLLTLKVQGFDPAFARRLNQAILRRSEAFVNGISQQMAREQMAFVSTEMKAAAAAVQVSKAKLLAFQTDNRLLDPAIQAQASGALTSELQATLTRQEAELRNLRSFLNENAYQVQALKGQLDATRQQLDIERSRTTGKGSAGRINTLGADFAELKVQLGFDEEAYRIAFAAVQNTRIESTRKIKSLVVISEPSLPETARYPRRLYNLVTLLVVCLMLYWIASLIAATVREHKD